MNNNNFCKVFQIDENNQVLYHLVVVNDEETGDNATAIEIKTFSKGLQFQTTISGFEKNNTTAEARLEIVDIEKARDFFNTMSELTNENDN